MELIQRLNAFLLELFQVFSEYAQLLSFKKDDCHVSLDFYRDLESKTEKRETSEA